MPDEGKKDGLRIEVGKPLQMISGFFLIVLGAFMPRVFNESVFPVLEQVRLSLTEESIHLIPAATLLVTMNIVRAVPHYIGVYWLSDTVSLSRGKRRIAPFDAALVLILLFLTYQVIEAVNDIHYDFGLPAVLMAGIIILYDLLNYNYVSLFKRTLFILNALFAVQFLDIMPAASFLPVGRGELSRTVKAAAEVMEMESQLNVLAFLGFGILSVITVMLFILIRDENGLREVSSLREANDRMRMEAHASEVQNRTFKEMQYLVHDLKSPLSVVQTLEGVVRMRDEAMLPEESTESFDRMEKALDQMSSRISQLLTLDSRDSFTSEVLLHDVMAQISIENYAPNVSCENAAPQALIYANQILLSRAVVNLVRNAVQAVPEGREPRVVISARREKDEIVFSVTDNGKGVSPEQQKRIWTHGYSGKGSSGLGLAFVQLAAERSGGRIEMRSKPGTGTTISLILPEEGADNDNGNQ